MNDIASRRPSYLPAGFELRKEIEGDSVIGLGQHADQIALIYTTGWSRDEWTYPLAIFMRPGDGAVLVCTEGRAGLDLDLGVPGFKATYHDGWWVGQPSMGESAPALSWDASTVHSITVTGLGSQVAVRAAKRAPHEAGAVSAEEMVRVARSLIG